MRDSENFLKITCKLNFKYLTHSWWTWFENDLYETI